MPVNKKPWALSPRPGSKKQEQLIRDSSAWSRAYLSPHGGGHPLGPQCLKTQQSPPTRSPGLTRLFQILRGLVSVPAALPTSVWWTLGQS